MVLSAAACHSIATAKCFTFIDIVALVLAELDSFVSHIWTIGQLFQNMLGQLQLVNFAYHIWTVGHLCLPTLENYPRPHTLTQSLLLAIEWCLLACLPAYLLCRMHACNFLLSFVHLCKLVAVVGI